MSTKKKASLSLRWKILLPLLALITLIFGITYFGAQRYIKKTIFEILEEETNTIIEYTGSCLDGDVLQALLEDPQYDQSLEWAQGMTDPRYWEQQECLASVGDFNPRTEIFTYHAVGNGALMFGLDQWADVAPENSYPFGEGIAPDNEDYPHLLRGLEGVYHYNDLKYDEEYDIYYYATIVPLENSAGETIGGMMIYLDANFVVENLQQISFTLLLIFLLIYGLTALLALGVTRGATARLAELTRAAERAAGGNYAAVQIKTSRLADDEVSALTNTFNLMLDKVRGREESLKKEVITLKIQIDEQKRKKQVTEIVDSEYFQDLQARAAAMRERRAKKDNQE